MKSLNTRQRLFVQEYLGDLNATQAAIRAGYSAKTAHQVGCYLMHRPNVKAALQDALAARQAAVNERIESVKISQERVLEELATAAFLDPLDLFRENGTLKPLSEMPAHARRAIAGIEVEETFEGTGKDKVWTGYVRKVKFVSKEGTLTLVGKHLKMFTDKTELSGGITVTASDTDEKL